MPRKVDMDIMKSKLTRINERTKEAETELKKLEDSKKELQAKIEAEERKIRTHNLCGIGGLVHKYFGENLTPEDFKEMLDFLFTVTEVKEFVDSEKEKRFLKDNPPVAVKSSCETKFTDNTVQNDVI